jgi:hypothetical protein
MDLFNLILKYLVDNEIVSTNKINWKSLFKNKI